MNQVSTPSGPFIDLLNRFPLEQLEEELEKVRGQIAQLDTAARLLELAIQSRRAANGDSTTSGAGVAAGSEAENPQAVGSRPKLKNAILAVMQDGGDREWSPTELHKTLSERGWAPTGTAARSQISNRLRDLLKSRQVTKPSDGRYRIVRNED